MDEKIVAWLLGDLDEEEEMQLEEEYLWDEEKFKQLKQIQYDLIDLYVRGKLTENQRKRFEEQFLSSPWQHRRIAFARALTDYSSKLSTSKIESEETAQAKPVNSKPANTEVTPWWRSIFFGFSPSISRYSFASLALLLTVGGSWLLLEVFHLRSIISELQSRQSDKRLELEILKERTRADQLAQELQKERELRVRLESGANEEQKTEKVPSLIAFILRPGMVRGNNGINLLAIPSGVSTIELKLDFSSEVDYKSFRVQLNTAEGNEMLSKDQLQSRASGNRRQVILRLSSSLLENDDYAIKLTGMTADGEYEDITNYSFRVEKK
jgi:hypothetical protein